MSQVEIIGLNVCGEGSFGDFGEAEEAPWLSFFIPARLPKCQIAFLGTFRPVLHPTLNPANRPTPCIHHRSPNPCPPAPPTASLSRERWSATRRRFARSCRPI